MMNVSISTEQIKDQLPGRSDLHLARKIWHILGGSFILYLYFSQNFTSSYTWGVTLFYFSLISFCIDWGRLNFSPLNNLITKLFSPFMRENEVQGLSGLPFYALGCALSLIFFTEKIAILSILFLVFADPISSLVGILYGKRKIVGPKSLAGALAGFGVCFFITFIYTFTLSNTLPLIPTIILFSLLAGLIGCISEVLSIYIDDNFTIPLVSGAGVTLLNSYFQVL